MKRRTLNYHPSPIDSTENISVDVVDHDNELLIIRRDQATPAPGSLSFTEIQMGVCSCEKAPRHRKGLRVERQRSIETQQPESEPAFTITIGGAYGLGAYGSRDSDPEQGKSNCYCLVKSNGRELHRTRTVQKNLSPTWDEEFDIFENIGCNPLEFRLYDSDHASVEYLGRAGLSCESFATQGFNGEVQIQEANRASGEACLRLKIKVLGMADYPMRNSPNEFTMVVKRGSQHKAWGLDISSQRHDALFVEEVRPGPFQDASENGGIDAELRRFDFIVAVNDAVGDSLKMMENFATDDEVVLRVQRPTQRDLVIKGRSLDQPLGLVFVRDLKGQALIVAHLDSGFFLEWNKSVADEDWRIMTGDHIIAVEGRHGTAHELVAQLKQATSFQLSIVRPSVIA